MNQAKFSSAVIATTIFTAKASHTQNIIFDYTLPLTIFTAKASHTQNIFFDHTLPLSCHLSKLGNDTAALVDVLKESSGLMAACCGILGAESMTDVRLKERKAKL